MATRESSPKIRVGDVLKILDVMNDSIAALRATVQAMGNKDYIVQKGRRPPKGVHRLAEDEGDPIIIIPRPPRQLAPICRVEVLVGSKGTKSNPTTRKRVR